MIEHDEFSSDLEQEIESEIEQEDYTLETTSERSSLARRLLIIFISFILYVIISPMDPNIVFNPVHSNLFYVSAWVVVLLSIIASIYLLSVKNEKIHEKSTYTSIKNWNSVMEYFVVLPVMMLVFTIINMFFLSFSPISGTSMEPNFHDHEGVIFSHLSKDYNRFDVIILYVPELEDPYLIKRVIGLPGETVEIHDNEIYINGTLLIQDFIDQDKVKTYCRFTSDINNCEFLVPENNYFVLGDNRDGNGVDTGISGTSIDSRTFGPISKDNTYGKVIWHFRDFNLFD
jgi:signal peptidase I